MAQPTIQARLCPHCANSIPADALKCSYCKRGLEPAPTHEWPRRVDDRGTPPPAPRETLPAPTAPSTQSSSVPARRGAEPGVYETRRATTVYEEPLGSARVVTQIAKGTEVTVVRSVGDWLEVRSKRGNPPGFIRADDAMLIRIAN